MKTEGHEDTFGAPRKGWPTFDKNGKRIKDEEVGTCEKATTAEGPRRG